MLVFTVHITYTYIVVHRLSRIHLIDYYTKSIMRGPRSCNRNGHFREGEWYMWISTMRTRPVSWELLTIWLCGDDVAFCQITLTSCWRRVVCQNVKSAETVRLLALLSLGEIGRHMYVYTIQEAQLSRRDHTTHVPMKSAQMFHDLHLKPWNRWMTFKVIQDHRKWCSSIYHMTLGLSYNVSVLYHFWDIPLSQCTSLTRHTYVEIKGHVHFLICVHTS